MSKIQLNSEKFLGIDVSKDELVIYNPVNGRTYSIQNTEKSIKSFIKKAADFGINKMILEATGRYDYVALLTFQNADYTVYRINPKYIKSFGRSFGDKAKTDKIDSRIISLYGEMIKPSPTKVNVEIEDLRLLMNRREQIVSALSKEKQHRAVVCNKVILKSIINHLKYLTKELKNINDILDETLLEDKELKHTQELVSSCKGIGKTASKALIIYLPELGQISNSQITSLIGVAPKNFDSGNFTGKRYINGGRKNIRNILYMCTMSLIRHKRNKFYLFYQKLVKQGKAKKVAMIAMIKKLIITLNAMVRTDKFYDEDYVWKS